MIRVLTGDCREVLKTLPDASVHCCVTSPPYLGLRSYGIGAEHGEMGSEPTPADYVAQIVSAFREVHRVLRPDAVCFVNLGDGYNNFRVSKGPGQRIHGRDNLHGKPEPDSGGRGWGGLKEKDLLMLPARVAIALQDDGWYLRSAMPWIKRSCMPESVKDRPTNAVEYVFMLTKQPHYYWDAVAVRQRGSIPAGTRAAKGSNVRSELKDVNGRPPEYWDYTGERHLRNSDLLLESIDGPHGLIRDAAGLPIALDVNPTPFLGKHFATYPPALIAPLIAAGTSERGCCGTCGAPWMRQTEKFVTLGWAPSCQCSNAATVPCTVLDCFAGFGTTGLVADRLGRDAVLIELNGSYAELARRRLVDDAPLLVEVA